MIARIKDLSVAEWLEKHPNQAVLVEPETPLEDVIKACLDRQADDAYILDAGKIEGHLALSKLVNHVFCHERPVHTHRQLFARVSQLTAADLVDPHFAYCRPEEKINEILHRQLQSNVQDLLVLAADSSPLGVVNLKQVVRESLK
jgi:predicted transcriptional regulator